jgi:hypothetical protein
LSVGEALCERELDLEMADVLPCREALGLTPIVVVVAPVTTVQIGVANAITILSSHTTTVATVLNNLHLP